MANRSLHCLGGEGKRSWRWGGLLLWDFYYLCGSDRRSTLSWRRRGAAVGGCGAGRGGGEDRCGRGGTRGRGGGLDRGGVISRGCFGSSRLVVVHLEDVLLEVSDPVLLHRQRTVKLHLAEPGGDRSTRWSWEFCRRTWPTIHYLLWLQKSVHTERKTQTGGVKFLPVGAAGSV